MLLNSEFKNKFLAINIKAKRVQI